MYRSCVIIQPIIQLDHYRRPTTESESENLIYEKFNMIGVEFSRNCRRSGCSGSLCNLFEEGVLHCLNLCTLNMSGDDQSEINIRKLIKVWLIVENVFVLLAKIKSLILIISNVFTRLFLITIKHLDFQILL